MNVFGTGQPTKPAIELLLNTWLNKMKLETCLWINMRSEPVMYVNGNSYSPKRFVNVFFAYFVIFVNWKKFLISKRPCENIDFGDGSIITTKDLDRFNRELERTVKQNIEQNNNIFEFHKDTFAALPTDRKDRTFTEECKNDIINKNVYGLEWLYKN